MSLFNPPFLLYFFILFIVAYSTYIIGALVLSHVQVSRSLHFRILQRFFTGYLVLIPSTAIFFTKGNTLLVLIPTIILLWILVFRISLKKVRTRMTTIEESLELVKMMWFLLFVFILFALKHVLSDGIIEHDYLFYSNVAYTMQKEGVEGILFGMYNNPEVHPYHYGDIWVTSLIASVFKTNYYHTTIFLTIPYLLFMVYLAGVALIKEVSIHFFKNKSINLTYVLGGVLIILSSLEYPFLNRYFEGTFGLIQWPKQSMIYVIFSIAIIYVMRKKMKQAFLIIMLLLPIYLPTIFFILPATGILILYVLFNKSSLGLKYMLVYFSVAVGIILYFGINAALSDTTTSETMTFGRLMEGLTIFPEQLIKKSMRYFLLYLPFILLFILLFYDRNLSSFIIKLKSSIRFKTVFAFLVSGFFFSLFFSTSFSVIEQDYDQIFYNGINPFLAILNFLIIIWFIFQTLVSKDIKYLALRFSLVIFIVLGIVYQYIKHPRYWGNIELITVEEDFYLELDKRIQNDDKIATYQYFEITSTVNYRKYYYKLYPLVPRIANFKYNGNYMPECINVHEMDTVGMPKRKSLYNYSYFIQYMDSIKKVKNKDVSPEEVQKLFLMDHKFDFVILPTGYKLPDEIKPLIMDSISRRDGVRVFELIDIN